MAFGATFLTALGFAAAGFLVLGAAAFLVGFAAGFAAAFAAGLAGFAAGLAAALAAGFAAGFAAAGLVAAAGFFSLTGPDGPGNVSQVRTKDASQCCFGLTRDLDSPFARSKTPASSPEARARLMWLLKVASVTPASLLLA